MKKLFKGKGLNLEIIGPPGCGKTTLARQVALGLSNENIVANLNKKTKRPRVKDIFSQQALTFFLLIPQTFWIVFYLNYGKNKLNYRYWKVVLTSWLKVTLIKFYHLRQDRDSIYISEPGYLMLTLGGCMYRDKNTPKKRLSNMVQKFCDLDILVVISVGGGLSLKRMNDRARGEPVRMKGRSTKDRCKIIKSSSMYAEEICKICEKRGVLVIRVHGDAPVDSLAKEVCYKVEELYEKNK